MRKQYWILGLAVSVIVSACGGNKEALYTRAPMPMEGDFDGVYQSDFGRLELSVESGNQVVGLYEKNDEYGRIEGKIKDNLLFFNWTQWNVEMRGKIRETSGRGVFQYMVDEPEGGGSAHHWLKGFWGYSKDEPTNPWNAHKLGAKAKKKLVPFDPAAYTGDEEEDADNAGGFQETQGGGDEGSSEPAGDDVGGGAEIF